MDENRYRARFPLMALTMLALLAAVWSGLLRLGWRLPLLQPRLPIAHGPLMVSGFLGTLISLERAVALSASFTSASDTRSQSKAGKTGLNYGWMYVGPALSGLGAALLIAGVSSWPGPLLMTLGSAGLVAISVVIVRRQFALYTVTMGLGALAWLVGNGLWLTGQPIPRVVFWWAGFLVLTIAGERLELARILRPSRASLVAFLAVISLLLIGLLMSTYRLDVGIRLAGGGMTGLALWLLRYDVARRTLRKGGLARFIAACLLSGYFWLAAGGLMGLIFGGVMAGPSYDAMLHAVFLGFAFSLIFGHAPIVFPAVLGVPLAYHPTFYLPLSLLHLSLTLRVAGDLLGWWAARQWGGLLNVVAVLLFLGNTARVIYMSKRT